MEVDIQKAYDTVDWTFLRTVLIEFGFHSIMVQWIMECVSTAKFTVCINGEDKGYFEGGRGLRQGDPLSPYLFTLVMEVFNLMLKRRIAESDSFKFHWKCKDLGITHLCFADDLLLFSYGNGDSVRVIKDALLEFKGVSGLSVSLPKSQLFFGRVKPFTKNVIMGIMNIAEGSFPVRYLGVPLSVTKLVSRNCHSLVDKVKRKILDWRNKVLSFAGRVQLINSVLASYNVYWASIFFIPNATNLEIEKLLRGFLWCNGELKQGKAKVCWKEVCRPKEFGGLGIKSMKHWNIALLSKHIWKILGSSTSLWSKWIRGYYLRERNFWDIMSKHNTNWTWKRFLDIRKYIRSHIVYCIGNGKETSAWHDYWNPVGCLDELISKRHIRDAGLQNNTSVEELLTTKGWPTEWLTMFPTINVEPIIKLPNGEHDRIGWRDNNGSICDHSTRLAWNSIIDMGVRVPW